MTKQFKAVGIKSTGRGSAQGESFHIGTEITDGYKSAIGKYLSLQLDAHALAFMLSSVATYHREAVLALADSIREADAKYGEPARWTIYGGGYDLNQSARYHMYADALKVAIEDS